MGSILSDPAIHPHESARERWTSGLSAEEHYWEEWLAAKGGRWSEEFTQLLDSNRQLPPQFTRLIDAPEGSLVKLLDVGAGPLTPLAAVWPGRDVVTVAVDPLADQYNRAIDKHGIQPLVRTRFGEAERLRELFGEDEFDLVYASNCIDHSYDPVGAMREMVRVVKPGCYVMLEHAAREAVEQNYDGLHQWNFDVGAEGELTVWRPGLLVDIEVELGSSCQVAVTAYPLPSGRTWLSVTLRKHLPGAMHTTPVRRKSRSGQVPTMAAAPPALPLRYQLADWLNDGIKKLPLVHSTLKRFLGKSRG